MMKKVYTLLFTVLVGLCFPTATMADVWDGSVDTEWTTDAQGRYMITTAAELAGLAHSVYNSGKSSIENYEGVTFILTTDVDLNNLDWNPIGYYRRMAGSDNDQFENTMLGQLDGMMSKEYFSGTFDGQGHTIKNCKVNIENGIGHTKPLCGSIAGGLFGAIHNATIKNIHFTSSSIYLKGNSYNIYSAALVGWSDNSTIANCSVVNCSVETDANYSVLGIPTGVNQIAHAGGVCGNIQNGTTIKDCYIINTTINASTPGNPSIGTITTPANAGSYTEERVCVDSGAYTLGWRESRVEAAILSANFGGTDEPYYWNEDGITPYIYYAATLDDSYAAEGSLRDEAQLTAVQTVVEPQSLEYTYDADGITYNLYTAGSIVTAQAYLEGYNGMWQDPGYFVTEVVGAEGSVGEVILENGFDMSGDFSYDSTTDRFLRVQEFQFVMPSTKTVVGYTTSNDIPTQVEKIEAAATRAFSAGGKIVVETTEGNIIMVVDMTGRVLYNEQARENRTEIALRPGFYIVNGIKVIVR